MPHRPEVYLVAPSGERRPLGVERVLVRLSGLTCELDLGGPLPHGMSLAVRDGTHRSELSASARAGNANRLCVTGDIRAGEIILEGGCGDGSRIELPHHAILLDYGSLGTLELTLHPPAAGVWEVELYLRPGDPAEGPMPMFLTLAFTAANLVMALLLDNRSGVPER